MDDDDDDGDGNGDVRFLKDIATGRMVPLDEMEQPTVFWQDAPVRGPPPWAPTRRPVC